MQSEYESLELEDQSTNKVMRYGAPPKLQNPANRRRTESAQPNKMQG